MNLEALKNTISDLKSLSKSQLNRATQQSELDDLYRSFLGKKGEVNLLLKSLGSMQPDKRKEAGKLLNILKSDIEADYLALTSSLTKAANQEKLAKEKVDISLPGLQSKKVLCILFQEQYKIFVVFLKEWVLILNRVQKLK